MKILNTICARGGSKGIPGKNIKLLNGKPLIGYSISIAKKFSQLFASDIALSTDNEDIKKIASNFGLITEYNRPALLANDNAGKIDALKDILSYSETLNNCEYDFIIDLDVTSPLRTITDLQNALEMLLNNNEALNIFSVSPANRNPYFNMVEVGKDLYVKLVKQERTIKSRQEAPVVYDVNASFYIYRREFFEKGFQTAITNRSLAFVVPHLCFDLDHPQDFTIMELLLREKLLDFEI